jgi:hypothetical protein
MKKTTLMLIVFVLVASMFLMAAAPSATRLARFWVRNRTGDTIHLLLNGRSGFATGVQYYLAAGSGWTLFTVERGVYRLRIWACDYVNTGTINLYTNVSLAFPGCGAIPNLGEPTMEKVLAWDDSFGWALPPYWNQWHFQY